MIDEALRFLLGLGVLTIMENLKITKIPVLTSIDNYSVLLYLAHQERNLRHYEEEQIK